MPLTIQRRGYDDFFPVAVRPKYVTSLKSNYFLLLCQAFYDRTGHLRPFCAAFCCIGTCSCLDCNHCSNCSCLTKLIFCCECRFDMCHEIKEPNGCQCKNLCCFLCGNGHCQCGFDSYCCKNIGQILCCDLRCAIPCDEDVPCMLNVIGITLMYRCVNTLYCCGRIQQAEDAYNEKK